MLNPGDVLGDDFEIEGPLSRGGMGAVFRAWQRSTDAPRAIKIMLPEWANDPSLRERFEREARASGRIRSDHVVKIIAYGVDRARGTPWIAMEYLTGATLEDRLESLGVPPKHTTLELLRQLFHGVAAAHAVGIVHRDLKPANVHVSDSYRADVPFTVKVLDFGIAKDTTKAQSSTSAMGTRLWMAPEQGDTGGTVRPSADVWALGLIVFWLLSGRHFWRHPKGPEIDLLHELYFAPIPTASQRLAEFGLPDFGAEFDAWFARSVNRDRSARFEHAGAAWEGLLPVLLELPSETPWSDAFRGERGSSRPQVTPGPPQVRLAPARSPAPYSPASPRTPLSPPSVPGGETPAPVARDKAAPALPRRWLVRWTALSLTSAVLAAVAAVLWFERPEALPRISWASVGGGAAPSPPELASEGEGASGPNPSLSPPAGMVHVPRGTFEMGAGVSEPDGPSHTVRVSRGFFIDILEVSARDYDACVRTGACSPSGVHGPGLTATEASLYSLYCNGMKPGRELHPINCIDQGQAQAFCSAAGKRLPTEAEWEYAARGSDRRLYPWGNEVPTTCDLTVVSGLCPATGTQPVGTRAVAAVSPFGAIDMSGNVWEWVADTWDEGSHRTVPHDDPIVRGASESGVLRGGGWDFAPALATTTHRQKLDARTGHVSTGVRCARSAPP